MFNCFTFLPAGDQTTRRRQLPGIPSTPDARCRWCGAVAARNAPKRGVGQCTEVVNAAYDARAQHVFQKRVKR